MLLYCYCCYHHHHKHRCHHHHHHHHHQPLSLLHSSLPSSQKNTGVSDQAFLIHCSAKNFPSVQHVLNITAFCIRIYTAGTKLSSLKLLCNLFRITPVVDCTNCIIWAAASCNVLTSSSFCCCCYCCYYHHHHHYVNAFLCGR